MKEIRVIETCELVTAHIVSFTDEQVKGKTTTEIKHMANMEILLMGTNKTDNSLINSYSSIKSKKRLTSKIIH